MHANPACPMYEAEEIECSGKGLILSSWEDAGVCVYCFIPNYNACYDYSDFREKHKLSNPAAVEAELRVLAKRKGCNVYFRLDHENGCPQPLDAARLDKLIAELGLKEAI